MKTYLPPADSLERAWFEVDADGVVLGRLASSISKILMGKHKPCYTDFLDTGDFVVVVNAEKVRLTGNKLEDKLYRRHSGRPGGLKELSAKDLLARHPDRLVRLAVKGMLPKTKLGKQMIRKLKVYSGGQHPHRAQQPREMKV